MPPRRRTISTNRRPRVAGLGSTASRPDEVETDTETGSRTSTVTEPRPASRPAEREHAPDDVQEPAVDEARRDADDDRVDLVKAEGAPSAAAEDVEPDPEEPGSDEAGSDEAGSNEAGAAQPTGGRFARLRSVPVLAAVLAVLLGLSTFFGVATIALRSTPAATNTALTDVATTAEVANQLGDALETVYSYDFARLDENERAAREVITTGFSSEFERLFTQVRELAPQQQAVVSATINVSAVQEIRGDRAVLVAFMDQQASTAANAEQASAAGRLTVVGERVDGRWKIASVESR